MGMILDIKVLDHIIIGANSYFSFADEGLIKKYEDNFLNLKIRSMFDNAPDYVKTLPIGLVPLVVKCAMIEEAAVALF